MLKADKTPILLCTGRGFERGDLPLVEGHAYTVIQTGIDNVVQR